MAVDLKNWDLTPAPAGGGSGPYRAGRGPACRSELGARARHAAPFPPTRELGGRDRCSESMQLVIERLATGFYDTPVVVDRLASVLGLELGLWRS